MHRKILCNCFRSFSIQNEAGCLWKVTEGVRNQPCTGWADIKKCLTCVKNFWELIFVFVLPNGFLKHRLI